MAALVAPGTPAATAPAAPAATPAPEADSGGEETITAADHGLAALLSGPLDEATEEAAAEPTDEEPSDPEATDEEAEPAEPKPDPMPDDVLFSEKALSTKEGVLKAKERLLELRKQQHEAYLGLKKYDQRVRKRADKLQHSVGEFKREKQTHQLLIDNVRSNLQATHSGDPEMMLQGLGHLYGMDGVKALELLNSRLIHKGRAPLDPQVQAVIDGLRQEVEGLKGGFQEREVAGKVQQLQQRVEQHHQRIGGIITANATQLPHLARFYADDPQGTSEYIANVIVEASERGQPLDRDAIFMNLEGQLAKHFTGAGSASKEDGGGPAPKQPPTVQRSPGQSVGPRTAAASTPRVPSEDEALRALSQDEAFMSSLFGAQ